MKALLAIAAVAAVLASQPAQAQQAQAAQRHHYAGKVHAPRHVSARHVVAYHRHHARPGTRYARYHDGRPAAWCGWEMRHLVGSDPGPSYNLARNWAHWGRAAFGPAPGVIGIMAHHVFKVIQVLEHGMVLAISGNDGHAVRTRSRSTRGVIAWRYAS